MNEPTNATDQYQANLAKAMSHPLRMRLLIELNRAVRSPKQLAEQLGEPVENVAHHVTVLRRLGCVELVEKRRTQGRGAVEHFYRATTRAFLSSEASEDLLFDARAAISATILQQAFVAFHEAAATGQLDSRTDRHLTLTHLTLTEEGWSELAAMLDSVLERAIALHGEAVNAGTAEDQLVNAELFVAHVPSAPFPSGARLRSPAP